METIILLFGINCINVDQSESSNFVECTTIYEIIYMHAFLGNSNIQRFRVFVEKFVVLKKDIEDITW